MQTESKMKKLLPTIAALAATLSSHAYAQSCDMSSEQQVGVVEIVQFRLADGVSDADFKAAAASTMPFLCGTDGFIRRTLSRGEDGLWIDHVEWTNADIAQTTAAAAMENETMMPFMMAIDPASISLSYQSPLALE